MNSITPRGQRCALALATIALVVNFWAWSLFGPLAAHYQTSLQLSFTALSFLVAIPVVIGSLGRIVLGVLTDHYGSRRTFSILCLIAALPVAALAFSHTLAQIFIVAFCLGIAGSSFAIGISFISAWFPSEQRGLALGIYGMGNIGTAISGFITPYLFARCGTYSFFLPSITLLLMAALFFIFGADAPGWQPSGSPVLHQLKEAALLPLTQVLALLYAITFGGFTAFGIYLPTLLKTTYNLGIADSAARAAGFVTLATLSRPLGGWLSDHFGGFKVLRGVFFAIAVLAVVVAFNPPLILTGTIAYLALAIALGMGNGGVFALLGKYTEPQKVGSVTGLVGAVGGLGGFFPPLVMGIMYQLLHSYTLALGLLSIASVLVFLYSSPYLRKLPELANENLV